MRNISILVLEVIWIVTGILCLGSGIKVSLTTGGNKAYLFFLMAVISFLFAWFRHKQRKKS